MKFEEVLPELRAGKEIRRKSWVDKRRYSFEGDKFIYYSNEPEIYFKQFMEEDILLADDWEIVQNKKKVKLRDLTEEQYVNYCRKCGTRLCSECPLSGVECNLVFDSCWFKNKDLYNDKFLDQGIEIEEEE